MKHKSPTTKEKENRILLNEIKEAVDNMNLEKQGKLKARPIEDLLNEL